MCNKTPKRSIFRVFDVGKIGDFTYCAVVAEKLNFVLVRRNDKSSQMHFLLILTSDATTQEM